MERAMGIEPTCEAWKASVLPLNYARLRCASARQARHQSLAKLNPRTCIVNVTRVPSPRMAALLLTGGRVVDPANRLDAKADVLISEGKIAAVGADAAKKAPRDAERMAV